MYLIFKNRVVLGMDGFIKDPIMGHQVRIFCFGLNIWVAWGDKEPDGNGYNIWLGFPKTLEVM